MEILDYGFAVLLFAKWKEDGQETSKYFTAAEVGDELEFQGLCGTASVNHRGNAVCNMTGFPGYQPGEWATPAEVWSTLWPDQKEALVRGLIAQHKSEVK